MVEGLGFRVSGCLGVRHYDHGLFRVWALGFKVQGLGLRVRHCDQGL